MMGVLPGRGWSGSSEALAPTFGPDAEPAALLVGELAVAAAAVRGVLAVELGGGLHAGVADGGGDLLDPGDGDVLQLAVAADDVADVALALLRRIVDALVGGEADEGEVVAAGDRGDGVEAVEEPVEDLGDPLAEAQLAVRRPIDGECRALTRQVQRVPTTGGGAAEGAGLGGDPAATQAAGAGVVIRAQIAAGVAGLGHGRVLGHLGQAV